MTIGAIIQARMSSNRFPGKILYKVNGKPLLQYLLESLGHCSNLDQLIVVTSARPSDDAVAEFCREHGIDCHRGALDDVAGRLVDSIAANNMDAFVRLSGDSPLLDYRLVDRAVGIFKSGDFDIVTNVLKRTFPKGQSVEVIKSTILTKAYPFMRRAGEREHVTPYFYSRRKYFAIRNFESGKDYGAIQLSVDTREDMTRFEAILSALEKPHWEYSFETFINQL